MPDIIGSLDDHGKPIEVRDRFRFVASGFLVANDMNDFNAIGFKYVPLH
jgi:hypothetical protein